MNWAEIFVADFLVFFAYAVTYLALSLKPRKKEDYNRVVSLAWKGAVVITLILAMFSLLVRYSGLVSLTFQSYLWILLFITVVFEVELMFLTDKMIWKHNINVKTRKLRFLLIGAIIILLVSAYLKTPSEGYDVASSVLHPETMTYDEFVNKTTINETITIIPYKTAFRKIGVAMSKYGSYYRVVDADYQIINGSIYWVGSIGFDGITRQWSHKNEGVPVFIASAMKDEPAKQVELKCKMMYSLGNYFGLNINRLIYERYPQYLHSTPVLQIHDGVPYYISMLSKYSGITFAKRPVGLLIVNACNGNIEFYGLDELDRIPKWVSFVYQEDNVEDFVHDWGLYIHGLWNYLFSGKDLKYPTGNIEITTTKSGEKELDMKGTDVWLLLINGHPYWFTAFRPPGSDQSINSMIGMGFVDAITGKMTYVETQDFYNDYSAMNNILKSPEISKTTSLIPTQPYPIFIDKKMAWFSPIVSTGTYEIYEFAVVDAKTGKVYIDSDPGRAINKWLSDVGGSQVEVHKEETGKNGIVYYVIIDRANGTVIKIPVYQGDSIHILPVNRTSG